MVEQEEKNVQNLIDKKEFRKRRKELFEKHGERLQKILDLTFENKISMGTIVERNAIKYSDKIAIKFEDTVLTYKEFNECVNKYAHYFISLGLKKGDIVEIFVTNRTELLIIFAAICKIGAINSMINADLRGNSLVFSLKKTPGRFIIVGSELIDAFIEIKSDLNLSEDQKLFFLPDKDSINLPDDFINLSQAIEDFPVHNPSTTIDVKTTDPMAYIFTSGTTGFPKAALCIHYRIVGGGCLFGLVISELNPGDTIYVPLPFFHAAALTVGWAAALASGAAVVICRKFSVSRFWDDIRKYNATAFVYVGEICRYLINQPPSPNDQNHAVKAIIGNGLRPEIWKIFKKRFNIDIIGEYFGGSDNAAVFANLLNFDCTLGMCSSSYAIVKCDLEEEKATRNAEGYMERVNIGEVGLLLFESKGATAFRGYTDEKATEAKLFRNVFNQGDLWFNTGDLVRDQGCTHA